MSSSQNLQGLNEKKTPLSSFIDAPLTPPPTDEKALAQASRVIALFPEIRAGKHRNRSPWIEFQLGEGEYDRIEHLLSQDEELLGFVNDKIRWVCLRTTIGTVKERKRLETPPEEIASSDEAGYVEQEERAAKRIADDDPDYKNR